MSDPQVPDLNALLGQAMQMQQQLMEAQARAAEEVLEGQAGGGAVVIGVTGAMEFTHVKIRPDAVDPDDVDMLSDMVLAALNDAMDQIQALQSQSLGPMGEMLALDTMLGSDGFGLGGFDLDEGELDEPGDLDESGG